MKNKNLLVIMIFFVVLFNSIVYSALNSEMFINGDAHIRVDKDIRITNVAVLEQVNGAYETYNSDYSKNTTSIQVTLPSSESFMVYEVTITNKGDTDYEVEEILEESYSNSNIKYELIDINKGTIIDGKTTYTFKIKFTTTDNNSDNKTTLVLKYTFEEWIPSLYKMVAHKSRNLDTNIDFGVAPTEETSGVYEMNSTKDDEYPVYYYRGIIDNNNVDFAGFCWKIVRTTETGGVKLIYNGVVGDDGSCNNVGDASFIGKSAFNANYNNAKYVGYTYDENTDSTIKKYIDDWYSKNMINYTGMLEDTIWCNDRSIYRTNGREIYYGGYDRLIENPPYKPILTCPRKEDSFTVSDSNGNMLLKYPIALLTADEVTLLGIYTIKEQNSTEKRWGFMTPTGFVINIAHIAWGTTPIGGWYSNAVYGVRPSVSIASGTMIKEGNGSVSNPYKLVEDKITKEWTFDYTGREQEFVVPYDGVYKLEVWGAQGGKNGGTGGYSKGEILLRNNTTLYINVGGQGENNNGSIGGIGGYNGGGQGGTGYTSTNPGGGGGGGASHISLKSGLLQQLESDILDILIIAGGGGGQGEWCSENVSGGGISGCKSITIGGLSIIGGTQRAGNAFGLGQSCSKKTVFGNKGAEGSGGGGGGLYGGFCYTGNGDYSDASGSGGSGYIGNSLLSNKLMYCYNCEESSEESTKTISTTNVSIDAISNYAKNGNGYAKITLITKK